MPDRIIKRVNHIGLREKQGQTFWFLKRLKKLCKWTDAIPEDDPEFQGLLEEEAPFSDVSAELPREILEEEEGGHQIVTDKPHSAFETLAAAALENAGIDTTEQIRVARATADMAAGAHAATQAKRPQLVETNKDEILYEITFDFPDDGIILDYNDTAEFPDATIADVATTTHCYPTQSCSSVVGNQPYDAYAPRVQFLQLREVQAHKSALRAMSEQKLHPGEMTMQQMHATTATLKLDNTVHMVGKELMMTHKHKIVVWGYLMTQYNLKPSLRKFGIKGTEAAVLELTQLHMMDTWKGDGSITT